MKIAIYTIAKNEAHFARRCVESAHDADYFVLADTGSSDETAIEARNAGAQVYRVTIAPWRFDHARNAALALVPADADVCVSLDLDEVMEPGWRAEVERCWVPGTTRLRYLFDWSSGIRFKAEKIHARRGYYWRHPCHEDLTPDPRTVQVWAETDALLVTHHPDPAKSRGQYLDLLKVGIDESPNEPRHVLYYARELIFHGRNAEGIAEMRRFLALPDATWEVERAYAMRMLGRAHAALGLEDLAIAWFRRATAEAPFTREPWCDLANHCYLRGNWPECYAAATRALEIGTQPALYTTDPVAWGALPHDLAGIAAWNLGMARKARIHTEAAVALAPDDERLRRNLTFMEAAE